MKKKTSNKLNMYGSVHAVVADFQNTWQGVPAFAAAVEKFENFLETLMGKLAEQSATTPGVTAEKQQRLKALTGEMYTGQRALILLARSLNDVQLEHRNIISRSDMEKLAASRFSVRCRELKTDLEAHTDELSQFGLEVARVNDLVTQLGEVDSWLNNARLSILRRKATTAVIAQLEHQIDELLSADLDSLVLVFRKTVPDFFEAFHNARKVIDYHGPTKSHGERDDGTAN